MVFSEVYNWKIFNFEDKELEKNIKNLETKTKQFIQKTDLEIYLSSYKILNNYRKKL